MFYSLAVGELKHGFKAAIAWFEKTRLPIFIRLIGEMLTINGVLSAPSSSDFPAVAHSPGLECWPNASYLCSVLNMVMGDMSEYHIRSSDFLFGTIGSYTTFLLIMISSPGCARVSCSRKELTKYWATICSVVTHLRRLEFDSNDCPPQARRQLVSIAKTIWRELESRGFEVPKDSQIFSPLQDSSVT